MVEHTKPIIINTGRVWSVFFRAVNPTTGEKKAFKYETGLNNKKLSKAERTANAKALKDYFTNQLKSNWDPFTKTYQKESLTLIENLYEILKLKKSLKPKTYSNYTDTVSMFKVWLKKAGYLNILAERFTNKMAREYLDYTLVELNNSGKTHNNRLGYLKTLFNDIYARDEEIFTMVNPFKRISKQPERKGRIFAFTKSELTILKNYLSVHNKDFYHACCFMYYAALRRPDLKALQIKHINMDNKMIIVHSGSTKNLKQESITICKELERIIEGMDLEKYNPEWYVFGDRFQISKNPIKRINDFTEYFREVASLLNIDKTKTFYSYKHTGLSDLYIATKDIYLIMKHARHSDVKITMKYLESLGLLTNDLIREANFKM